MMRQNIMKTIKMILAKLLFGNFICPMLGKILKTLEKYFINYWANLPEKCPCKE
jgi:hypothetical protein